MIDIPERVAKNIDRFTGRAWLLPKILEWLDDSDERLLLLTGGPGTGKSMIVGWLAGFGPLAAEAKAHIHLERLRDAVKAAYFCQSSGLNTPRLFAESIASQLANKVSGYREALKEILEDRVQIVGNVQAGTAAAGSTLIGVDVKLELGMLGDEFGFDQAFVRPLRKLYADGYSEPMLLLVDALDEALGYTGDKTLPELLSTLGDLPTQVRILVTSRDDPRVLAFYDDVPRLDVIKGAPPDIDDVQDYVSYRLTNNAGLAPAQSAEFSHRVATQAKGVFLYAAVVLDELLPLLPQLPGLESYPLPDGLSGLYRAFLKRELGTEDKGRRWHHSYKPLLGLIAVAQGDGLTASQLDALVGQETAEPLDACKQYLSGELPDGPFRPFHASFAEFLLEDKKNRRYHIDPPSMHRRIAEYYWTKYSKGWSQCDDYGLDSLAVHLYQGQQFQRLADLINEDWMGARISRSNFSAENFLADLDQTWGAAIHEQNDAAKAIVQSIRLALIRASVVSASVNYPPLLVARALEDGLWTPVRVFYLATLLRSAGYKLSLKFVDTIGDLTDMGKDLVIVALVSSDLHIRIFDARGEMVVDKPENQLMAGKTLKPLKKLFSPFVDETKLSEEAKRNIIIDATSIADHPLGRQEEAALWSAVLATGRLPLEDAVRAERMALEAAQEITDPSQRLRSITKLAHSLTGAFRVEAIRAGLAATEELDTDNGRVDACVALAPLIDGQEKSQLLLQALTSITQVRDIWEPKANPSWAISSALARLAPLLAPDLAQRALKTANSLSDAGARANALVALIPQLPSGPRDSVVGEVFEYARRCIESLRKLSATDVGASIQTIESQSAVAEATNGSRPRECVHLIQAVIPVLTQDAKHELLRLGFESLPSFDQDTSFHWLFELAPLLDNDAALHVLDTARRTCDPTIRARVYGNLAALVPAEQRRKLFNETKDLLKAADPIHRIRGFSPWLPHIADELQQEVVEGIVGAAEELAPSALSDLSVAGILAATLEETYPRVRGNLMERALNIALAPGLQAFRDRALELLAPNLEGALLQRAFDEYAAIEDQESRVSAVAAIASQIKGLDREEVIHYAFHTALQIFNPYRRVKAIAKLIDLLPDEVKKQALIEGLHAARDSREFGTLALGQLAPHLTADVLEEGIEVARHPVSILPPQVTITEGLAIMAPKLTGEAKKKLIEEVLGALPGIDDSRKRGDILIRMIPTLDGESLEQCWIEAKKLGDSQARAKATLEIARRLTGRDRETALDECEEVARVIVRPLDRMAALAELATELPGDRKKRVIAEALTATLEIADKGERAEGLSVLASSVDDTMRRSMLREALSLLEQTESWRLEGVLMALTPQLESELLEEAARLTQSTLDVEVRARLLASVAARLVQVAKGSAARTAAFRRINEWLWSTRGIPRPHTLYFCTRAFFEQKVLDEDALLEILRGIREISDEWEFV